MMSYFVSVSLKNYLIYIITLFTEVSRILLDFQTALIADISFNNIRNNSEYNFVKSSVRILN